MVEAQVIITLLVLTLTLVSLTTAQQEECPTSWPGGVQLGVPEYFYAFNPGVDMMVPRGDDTNSPRLTPGTVFPFYGQLFTYMYVSTNGALYFADPPTWFPQGGMPIKNVPLIGPLFVDTDTSTSEGRVYYQATTEADILCRFSEYVRKKRLDALNFKATWAFIATWHNMRFFKGNSSDPVNTFQVVIATDGHNSFALFNYGELNWSIGPDIIHAQVGFNSGIGDNHHVIAESGTGATANLHNLTGNTRDIGRWLFRINKDTIKDHGSEGLVASFTVKENRAVKLTCPSADLDYRSRFWLRGFFDDSDRTLLFSQTNSSAVTSHNGDRMDMSVNNATFELTIGETRVEDNSYFSCEVLHGMPLIRRFDNVELQVYTQPEITMTGLNETTLTKDTMVKVTCTIPRLSPAIETGAFQLLWGGLDNPSSVVKEYKTSKNLDKSYMYTITGTKTVTIADDGKEVICSVVPVRGSRVVISRTLAVVTPTNEKYEVAAERTKTKTNVLVIAGVAGGVYLLLVVIMIALAFFCTRRKDKHDNVQAYKTAMDDLGSDPERSPNQYGEEMVKASKGPLKGGEPPPDLLYEEITNAGYHGLAPLNSTSKTLSPSYEEDPYLTPVRTFEEWLHTNHISPDTEVKLRQHHLTCTEDLKRLTEQDVKEMGVVMGDRKKLIEALSALK